MTERAFVKNVADPKQVKEAGRKVERKREKELNDLRRILSEDFGRRFIWRYLELCGVFKSSFTGNSETFFNEGKRVVGLTMIKDINDANPEAYLQMVYESKEGEM